MVSRLVLRSLRNSSRLKPLLVARPSGFYSLCSPHAEILTKSITYPANHLLGHSALPNYTLQKLWFSSSASSQPDVKEQSQSAEDEDASLQSAASDAESNLSIEDLVKLVAEKDELLKTKNDEIEKMQDKVLRSYAEMENVIDRMRRQAENSKKFAIQNFAKGLLDVSDNLGRASSVVKESFSKLDNSKESTGAVPLLKTLLEGVEMTDKQLVEVFRKFGVEKFDPVNEQFDPNRHHAVFQIPDASKPPGTVAAVIKTGYMIYDRVLRPAEVGVTESVNEDTPSS